MSKTKTTVKLICSIWDSYTYTNDDFVSLAFNLFTRMSDSVPHAPRVIHPQHVMILIKVVIIINLSKDKNQHKMLNIQQIFPKLYRCLLYIVFHNLEPQNARLVDVKRDLH